jgi:hypothetical protein
MPKSKVTKRAKVKRLARKKQKTARVHVRELADMINKLEEYGESISEDILEIDGEVFLNPTQEAAIQQILQGDKEKEDGR